jgi:hypothetical protein
MAENGLSTGRNMYHTCENNLIHYINIYCVSMKKYRLFNSKHNGMASIKIDIMGKSFQQTQHSQYVKCRSKDETQFRVAAC